MLSVNGPIPRAGVVNVNIDKVCMNYTDVVIKPGTTTLEDHVVRPIKEVEKEPYEQENLCPEFGDIYENSAKLLLNIMYVEIKIENALIKEKAKDQHIKKRD